MNKKVSLIQFANVAIISCTILWSSCSPSQSTTDKTTVAQAWEEFSHPADSTRTKVWWFHGETETTREGITADLEAYKRAGIGGVVYYDQVHGKAENALPAFSAKWWEMLKFAASEAKRIGLSFEVNLSNGFVAGGPWITKRLGMQRLTASDTIINGKQRFSAILPAPGKDEFWDVAVLAFPAPQEAWETSDDRHPQIVSSFPQLSGDLFYQNNGKLVTIPAQEEGKSIYVNLDFETSFTARSISYQIRPRGGKSRPGAMNPPGPPAKSFYGVGYKELPDIGQLEVSDDGIHYQRVCDLKPIYQTPSNTWTKKNISFPAISGRYFRLNFHDWYLPKDNNPDLVIGNMSLSSRARMDQWEERAALFSEYILKNRTPAYTEKEIINPTQIINLTQKMDSSGKLEWEVPEGEWVVMRFAHQATGGRVKHGRANLMGLECDKMSVEAATVQWNNYTKPILDSLNAIGCMLKGITMDSHEAGSQNWTPGFEQDFLQRKGYDIHTYLPAMMGYIVGSVRESDGFLYDMRRTMADMISDNYYGTLQTLCNKEGVDFTAQATGNGLSLVADNLQAKGRVQKPQGEFWTSHPDGGYDVKETSSAAHFYGKAIASAEAFTGSRYRHCFADQKNSSDYAYAFGVNELVLCASAYQPWLDKFPGSTAGGKHYCLNRNNTYWEYSKPFWDYQARCTGLMRKGTPIIDICVYLGQNPPVKLLTYRLPEMPEGYDFDVCTAEALINRTTAINRRLTLPTGMSYSVLAIQRNNDMPLQVLHHIAKLVKEGVTVCGPRPQGSESLKDATKEKEYQMLVEQLWGKEGTLPGVRTIGKGKLYADIPLSETLMQEGIHPDIAIKSGNTAKDKVYFTHRRLVDADLYFLNNHSDRAFDDTIRLRTTAHYAQYWDAVTGNRFALPVQASGNTGLLLKLVLAPRESGYIVTSDYPNDNLIPRIPNAKEEVTTITGDWDVYFDPKWGGPGKVTFTQLTDWTKHANPGIRFYSGTAVYNKELVVDRPKNSERLLLRFPHLGSLAKIWVNEKEVATVWCSPWEADITEYVNEGQNQLKIEVVNSLMNRMIGDANLPQDKRYTYAYPEIATSDDTLVPSGIVDEVLLVKR